MPTQCLGFDIYGTLIDVQASANFLLPFVGNDPERARRFSELWREKGLEYTFRRALMHRYQPFPVCSREALDYTDAALRTGLTASAKQTLLEDYQRLPAFADVPAGLAALRAKGHRLAAFSNGPESSLQPLLKHNGLLDHFDLLVSVDDRQTFKPDPVVYGYLQARFGSVPTATWLISSNPFDVAGAKHAGLRAAWIRRSEDKIFDPMDDLEPDLIVPDMVTLAETIEEAAG